MDLFDVINSITNTYKDILLLITALCYVTGLGFGWLAITSFRTVKTDHAGHVLNINKPLVFLIVAVLLINLPSTVNVIGDTLYGGQDRTPSSIVSVML